jgi:hypothetical protein
MYKFKKYHIPDRMMPSIHNYIQYGVEPGSFLSAIIRNDLTYAVLSADEENMDNIPAFVSYFHEKAPAICWGNAEIMDIWIESHRKKREEGLCP